MTAQAPQSSSTQRKRSERLAARFLRQRRDDPNCDAPSFLGNLKAADLSSRDPSEIVEVLAIEQDERWGRGQRPPAESFLRIHQLFAPLGESAFDLIYAEYLLREELGEAPELDEFLWRFPDWEQPLRDQFALRQALSDDQPSTPPRSSRTSSGADPRLDSTLSLHGDDHDHDDNASRDDRDGAFRPAGFQVMEEIGRGAMGVVYRAKQKSPERIVALKAFRGGQLATEADRERFRREAELAARLQHPHFVQIFDIRVHDDMPYMVLEFVDGVSLAEAMGSVPLHPRDAALLTATLARAMHLAHLKGVLHRDLKPSNVLLAGRRDEPIGRRQAKITDFGLAKRLDADSPHSATISGDVIGTPCYMAPEQALGHSRKAGPAADIYSLGALLYEMLTGRPPFRADTAVHVLQQVVADDPVPPRQLVPGLAADLETICLRCLRKSPDQRYPDALAMAEDLERYLEGEPILARKTRFWERGLRRVRRQPLVAALSLGLAVAVLLGIASLALAWRIAAQRATDERIGRQHAEISERGVRASARRLGEALYGYRIAQAAQSWDAGDRERFGETLDQAAIGPSGEDYRGWEWFALDRRRRAPIVRIPIEPRSRVDALAISADGSRIAAGLSGSTVAIRVWSLNPRKEERDVPWPTNAGPGPIAALTFDRNGEWLAASRGRRVRVWDRAASLAAEFVIPGDPASAPIRALAFSSNGDRLFVGDDQGTVYAVRVADGRIERQRAAGRGPIRALTIGSRRRTSSRLTAMAATGGGVVALDGETLEPSETATAAVAPIRLGAADSSSWALGPDADCIAVGADRAWRLMRFHSPSGAASDPNALETETETFGARSRVTALAFAVDGLRIAVAEEEGGIGVWDSSRGPEGSRFARSAEEIAAFGFEADESGAGRSKFHALGRSGRLRTYDADDGSLIADAFFEGMRDRSATAAQATISPSGRLLAFSVRPDGRTLFVLPTSPSPSPNDDGAKGRTLVLNPGEPVSALVFAADDSAIAVRTEPGSPIRVWSLGDGKERSPIRPDGPVVAMTFAPDGRTLAIATDQGVIQLVDLASGEVRWRSRVEGLRSAGPIALTLAFDARGARLASASSDGAIQWIDAATGSAGRRWTDAAGTGDLAFFADGQRLAASYRDGVRIWDASQGQVLLSLKFPDAGLAASGGAIRLRFSDDGRLAAIRDGRGRVIAMWSGAPDSAPLAATSGRFATRLLTEAEDLIEDRDYDAARSLMGRIADDGTLGAAIERWRQSLSADLPPSLSLP